MHFWEERVWIKILKTEKEKNKLEANIFTDQHVVSISENTTSEVVLKFENIHSFTNRGNRVKHDWSKFFDHIIYKDVSLLQ